MPDPSRPIPAPPETIEQLEDALSNPWEDVVKLFETLDGDIIFLGVGGKMGPTMARMARRAADLSGKSRRIIGVSRFSDASVRKRLDDWGIETVACDLMDEQAVQRLPDAAYVVSMAGFKFGASQSPPAAWAANCYLPTLVFRRYRKSRIVVFSTGNVYGMVPRDSGGSTETDPLDPDGDYAMAAVGRERLVQYFCEAWKVPTVLLRLNYATELRYGVLVDLAQRIHQGQPVNVAMGYVNVIWLADANAMTLLALRDTTVPATVLNMAGPDILSTREVAERLARHMNLPVRIEGEEQADALLSNGRLGASHWGQPRVSVEQLLQWTAAWVAGGRPTLGKPTHFQTRSGQF